MRTVTISLQSLHDEEGVSIGGRRISNLRYADDTEIAAESERELEMLANSE